MKRKSKCMPLDEHLKTADDLRIAQKHIMDAFLRTQEYYPITGRLMKKFHNVLPGTASGIWTELNSLLDDEYHRIINDEQFKELGHIYYSSARYAQAIKRIQKP